MLGCAGVKAVPVAGQARGHEAGASEPEECGHAPILARRHVYEEAALAPAYIGRTGGRASTVHVAIQVNIAC